MTRRRSFRNPAFARRLLLAIGATLGIAAAFHALGAESGQANQRSPDGPDAEGLSLSWAALSGETHPSRVELTGLSPETLEVLAQWEPARKSWREILVVYATEPDKEPEAELPPMAGAYRVEKDHVVFLPAFPLGEGMTYFARLDPAKIPKGGFSGLEQVATLRIPLPDREPVASVSAVYPTSSVLPENLLKFYLHFSHPMSRGDIYSHLRLLRSDGSEVDLPFLELDEELWDPDRRRITVFINPGRIKRGLKPREELGPALESGKSYVLEIDAALRDGSGLPLREQFRKSFRVGPPDTDPPDPAAWKLSLPSPGTNEALQVRFKEPLDHALCTRLLHVVDSAGRRLEGRTTLDQHESLWSFVPAAPWTAGKFSLVVPNILEDLAGNQPGRPFDVDVFDEPKPVKAEDNSTISFEID